MEIVKLHTKSNELQKYNNFSKVKQTSQERIKLHKYITQQSDI